MRRLRLEAQVARFGLSIGIAKECARAGVDLGRADHAGQPPAWMLLGPLDLPRGHLEIAITGRFVPVVLDKMAVVG